MRAQLDGVLLIDKPQGLTSHDVVQRVRRILGIKAVGHAGTLDPLATGLLVLLIGKATKLSQYLMGLNKVYVGTLRLGQTTDSYDSDGSFVEQKSCEGVTQASFSAALESFVGDQYQIAPMFSARKVNGVALYKLARQGKEVEREPRFIRISRLTLKYFQLPDAQVEVRCSKGTYIRSLAHDLGQKLGCGAHLIQLRRTGVGHLSIKDAITLETLAGLSSEALAARLIATHVAVPETSVI